ncbi:MAG: hypothetical protein KDA91_23080 [Planctomycetaceae bacterium]|nr:hypothetical protein [Planctomycetaceae bacterium]
MKHLVSILLTAIFCTGLPAFADDEIVSGDHTHQPILVRSRPVIERLPLKVIHPVDVLHNSLNETLVADSSGQMVFRIDSVGQVSTLSRNLKGLARMAESKSMGLHFLLTEQRQSRIIRITDNGYSEEVCELPFAAQGLAADDFGNLWTCSQTSNAVFRITSSGERTLIANLAEPAKDLVVDSLGATVLLASGKVMSVTAGGATDMIGYLPASAWRLQLNADQQIVAISRGTDDRCLLSGVTATSEEAADRLAIVPDGTSAFAFDALGNLILANPELRAVTRVTSQFRVPCPHCGQLVPMVFSADAPPAAAPMRRSF